MDRLEAIERLAQLRNSGVLSDEEFRQQKERLLAGALVQSPSRQILDATRSYSTVAPLTQQVHVYHDRTHDTRTHLMYEASKKSVLVAYLLWFFLSFLAVHRFYVHKWISGFAQLIAGIVAVVAFFPALAVAIFSNRSEVAGTASLFLLLGVFWVVWVFADAIFIPRWVRRYNQRLVDEI